MAAAVADVGPQTGQAARFGAAVRRASDGDGGRHPRDARSGVRAPARRVLGRRPTRGQRPARRLLAPAHRAGRASVSRSSARVSRRRRALVVDRRGRSRRVRWASWSSRRSPRQRYASGSRSCSNAGVAPAPGAGRSARRCSSRSRTGTCSPSWRRLAGCSRSSAIATVWQLGSSRSAPRSSSFRRSWYPRWSRCALGRAIDAGPGSWVGLGIVSCSPALNLPVRRCESRRLVVALRVPEPPQRDLGEPLVLALPGV